MNVLFFVSAISWWQICYPCLSKLQNIRPCDKSYAQTIISGQLLAVSYVGQCMVSVLSQKYFNRNPGEAVIMALQWTQSGTHFTESENWEDCPHLGPLPFCRYPCIFNSWNHHGLSKPSQCLNISVCFYVGMLILQFQSPQVATFCFFFRSLLTGMSHSSLSEDDDSLDSAFPASAFPASGRFRAL